MLLLKNLFILLILASPLFLLDWLKSKFTWFERNYSWLSILVWLMGLIVVYFFVLPSLNLEPNRNILYNQ